MATDTLPLQGIAELKAGAAFYGGWTSLRITRSIEQIAGTFELSITERWPGQPQASPIRAGQACQVLLDGEPVITGYTDTLQIDLGATSHDLRVSGRDKTGDLVDCSAIYKSGQWRNVTIDQVARDLLAPFGLGVFVHTDVGAPFPTFNIQEGETVFECLDRAARMRALLLVSDPLGNLVITRASQQLLPVALEEGVNILHGRWEFSWKERHSSYLLKGQAKGTDTFHGAAAARPSGQVTDEAIDRYRPLIVLAEEHGAGPSLRDRAEWERNVRQGRGNRGTITVQGWRRPDGQLWMPNALVRVRSPLLWLDADLLVVGCAWTLDERGTTTELTVSRREAFDLVEGISASKLKQKLNDKLEKEKKKKADDGSMM